MKLINKVLAFVLVLTLLVSAAPQRPTSAAPVAQESTNQYHRQLISRGVTFLPAASTGIGGLAWPEIRNRRSGGEEEGAEQNLVPSQPNQPSLDSVINRSYSRRPDAQSAEMLLSPQAAEALPVPEVEATPILKTTPGLGVNFEGLNHFDERFANNGNQFSLEPPDQGLCVGNGLVFETVNGVLQFFDTSGNPVTGPIDQNTFYGYPPAIERTDPPIFGPFITDPNCYYDPEHQRWYHTVLTLDVDPETGDFLGTNHLDLAVSQTPDPTGAWNLYFIPAHNNGKDGTPNHHCSEGFCIGDYPQIGADQYGFYISTNEYSFFGPEFTTAQIYAMSKAELAAGVENPKVIHFDNLFVDGTPGFTVWPALSPAGHYFTEAGGAEFFLSSMAAEEAGNESGMDNRIGVWGLFNTSSLDSPHPNLILNNGVVKVQTYGVPPLSEQKKGPFPLGQCINDTDIETPFGEGCWQFFFLPEDEPEHNEKISRLDSGDSRMMRTWFVNGRLIGALDTILKVGGEVKAGIAYFILGPSDEITLENLPIVQGYVAAKDNNVNYPAIAVLPSGHGAMTFTLVGEDYYPSAAYTPFHQDTGPEEIHIARLGRAPSDGFTSYKSFVGDPPRTRWGDYSAAVTDGENIWLATEYIESRCNLREFVEDFTCGQTRSALANWTTRVFQYTPSP